MSDEQNDQGALDRIMELRRQGRTPSEITAQINAEGLLWSGEPREWNRRDVMAIVAPPRATPKQPSAVSAPRTATQAPGRFTEYVRRDDAPSRSGAGGAAPSYATQRLYALSERVDNIVTWSAILNGLLLAYVAYQAYRSGEHTTGLLLLSTAIYGAILVVCATRILLATAQNVSEIRDELRG